MVKASGGDLRLQLFTFPETQSGQVFSPSVATSISNLTSSVTPAHSFGQWPPRISASPEFNVMFAVRSGRLIQNHHRPDVCFKLKLAHWPVLFRCPTTGPSAPITRRGAVGYGNRYLQEAGNHQAFPFSHLFLSPFALGNNYSPLARRIQRQADTAPNRLPAR
jgi:hypothetical protein